MAIPVNVTTIAGAGPDATHWDEYVLSSADATGYHLLGWRKIIEESFGHPTLYLFVRDGQGHVQGVLPLVLLASKLFGRFLISIPFVNYGGLIAAGERATSDLLAAAIEGAKSLQADHIELRHARSCDIPWPSACRKVSMRLELPKDFNILWNQFSSKLRSQVRRAQREGMTARIGGIEFLDDFYSVFARCMRDLGTPVYSKSFFTSIFEHFPKETRLCLVSLQGKPLAAGLMYAFRSRLEIPWAASDRRFNRSAPNMLLYSSVLEHACNEGFTNFDFGRSSPGSGTYRFKEQWGAKPHQLHWYYWMSHGHDIPQLNPQNPKYELAIKLWQQLPLPLANWLGPHIVKYLP
jgi:FemAB-related protein (PEP-CTERM system-associated)